MTGEGETGDDLASVRARLMAMRRSLGAHLALYRQAAGLSQPQLAHALASNRTRSAVSKVESGDRGMPASLWAIADQICGANGALIAEHTALVEAQRDYRGRCQAQRQEARQAAAQAQLETHQACAVSASAGLLVPGDDALVHGELAGELLAMITELAKIVGRRKAMELASWALAALSLSDVDADDHTRLAYAVTSPSRVDDHVINNLAVSLASCKRLEDKLGSGEVLDIVLAQHTLVRRLLKGELPTQFRKALHLLDANMACTIGGYLIGLSHPTTARSYFDRARKAAHQASNPTYAAYAAVWISITAFLRQDTPAALDAAAAARSLAARTKDAQLKALAEKQAAAAYALDGQYQPCMSATGRAHDLLTRTNGSTPESPAYWVGHGTIDSHHSTYLCLLDKPKQAVQAAISAHSQFDRNYVIGYTECQIRLGHALILDKEITEGAHILSQATSQAHLLSPRLTEKIHTARTLLQPWTHLPVVRSLDEQLHACGLPPTIKNTASQNPRRNSKAPHTTSH